MKKAVVIFNGIRYPYHVFDPALGWARKNQASLHLLFLKLEQEPDEGYIFPSDLDAAEDLSETEDADRSNQLVLSSQVKVFSDMARSENVEFSHEILNDPKLDEVLQHIESASKIFIDQEFDEKVTLGVYHFKLKELIKKSAAEVEVCKA